MAKLSNKKWLKQQLTLAHNIVSGHKSCCAKALRKLVSVSYSEESFSSSR